MESFHRRVSLLPVKTDGIFQSGVPPTFPTVTRTTERKLRLLSGKYTREMAHALSSPPGHAQSQSPQSLHRLVLLNQCVFTDFLGARNSVSFSLSILVSIPLANALCHNHSRRIGSRPYAPERPCAKEQRVNASVWIIPTQASGKQKAGRQGCRIPGKRPLLRRPRKTKGCKPP